MKLVFASRNEGKLVEVRQCLVGSGWQVIDPASIGLTLDVQEDGKTMAENAARKARAAVRTTGVLALADDSGLEVDALGGDPGVHSARYCGQGATDIDRYRAILHRMVEVPEEKRTARFRCVMCLAEPDGGEHFFEGVCEGRIAHHARGSSGFGYDPIFVPEGFSMTFAELGLDTKNRISHRARALHQVIEFLRTYAQPHGR